MTLSGTGHSAVCTCIRHSHASSEYFCPYISLEMGKTLLRELFTVPPWKVRTLRQARAAGGRCSGGMGKGRAGLNTDALDRKLHPRPFRQTPTVQLSQTPPPLPWHELCPAPYKHPLGLEEAAPPGNATAGVGGSHRLGVSALAITPR